MEKLSSKYNFKAVEKNRYQYWLDHNLFTSGKKDLPPFTIVIPPPNVTGNLHLGHAWDNTLQDIIIRRKKMMGFDTLFLPGMDHAGIATQTRVEQRLKNEGITRYDLGRTKFLERVWSWKDEYAANIKNQWKALGLAVDYTKEKFTLDKELNDAVNYIFIKLYEKGLIYRGNRIINWDVEAKTAISNIEVEHEEKQGKLYYFRYPLVDEEGYLVVATTRPETMFADQALMIHPEDQRYQKYLGKTAYIPGTGVEIPIISDTYVDQNFGSGVVKVTPAHDANDFEVAIRHNLAMPLCMNEDGTMNKMAFQYESLDRFECRRKLVEKLTKEKLVEKIEDYVHTIGFSERTGVVVEPRLSLQWFVKMDLLAEKAIQTQVNFYPKRFKKTFINWMENIQDWCISRQLWWGHRIPCWYKGDEHAVQVESPGEGWVQDDDVLDTWFSSALWPFSTLGWPQITDDYKRYYPTNVLVTGYDIIFFWVSRMIFQALEFTNQDPFKDVLIHGLIRAKDGRKMSKSNDNGVDPMEIIDQYGTDSLRYFLATNSAPGADMRYEQEKVESSWNFINKLWNIARFIRLNINDYHLEVKKPKSLFDRWILTRLSEVIITSNDYYEKYEFGEAAKCLYNFIWDDFASWYVEIAKLNLNNEAISSEDKEQTQAVLLAVLKAILKLLHPIIPFVTEALFLEVSDEQSILKTTWPKVDLIDLSSLEQFHEFSDMITKVRNLRSEHQVAPSHKIDMHLVISNDGLIRCLQEHKRFLQQFLGASNLVLEQALSLTKEALILTGNQYALYVVKSDLIDPNKEKETLINHKKQLEAEIKRSESMLNNKQFLAKAPKEKIKLEEEKYQSYLEQYRLINEKLGK